MKLLVNEIEFGYNKQTKVLNRISLEAKDNDIIIIVGVSGCGKSTLLRLLSGIIRKTKHNFLKGDIRIDGCAPEEFVKQGKVGFMFQEPTLFPNLSVKRNISLPLKLLKRTENNLVDEHIKKVGLSRFADFLPSQLSGGMKTRVALARTFVTQPSLLLLDEPFSGLDISWKFQLYRELEKLRKLYSTTIIMVTHDIQEALLLSNHILVFGRQGNIIENLQIDKPLPRVFKENAIKALQEEYLYIQNAIMNN